MVGLLDKDLSQRLQLILTVTLVMTVQETQQSEEVKTQVDQQGEQACAVQEMLEGLQGVAVYMDDIIVHGRDMGEHEEWLQRVMERLESAGLKLNAEKCVPGKGKLRFLGQVINKDS
eukprot:superscaffoldBa00000557_g5618